MQHRYVGDIGDFGKYGLLRALCRCPEAPLIGHPLRLGIVWYLYPNESHNADGKHIDYLSYTSANHAKFRACDPPLYESLRRLVAANNRHVGGVRESEIFPDDTLYYESSLSYGPRESRLSRQAIRGDWFDRSLQATAGADVLFVDPDNGISETMDPLRKNGPKFVYIDDLCQFAGRGQSLVIYHHLGRRGTATQQIRYWAKVLQSNLGMSHLPCSLWYHRGTARAYFIVAQERHRSVLENRLASFLGRPWSMHFELVN